MNAWLSQNGFLDHDAILPAPDRPHGEFEDFPVGGIDVPSGRGIGFVKVPSISPMTAVHSPDPNLTGCFFDSVSVQRQTLHRGL